MFLFIYSSFLVYLVNIQSIGGTVQDIYWRNYIHGDIPYDAYQGAPGKYIGQFNFKENDLVGTIYAENGITIGEYGGKISTEKDIRILCSSNHIRMYWEYIDLKQAQEQQLQDAVKGGFEGTEHYNLFIGKAIFEEEWRIGKVHGYEISANKGLWVWDQNLKGTRFYQFFILKYNITDAFGKQC